MIGKGDEMKMKMNFIRKIRALAVSALAVVTAAGLFSCGAGFDTSNKITVVSREDGSGTRSAFEELFEVETMSGAEVNDKTGLVLTNIEGNVNAIGYVSLGSLNDSVKAVKINGVLPTAENVKNGSYEVSRPFNIATKGTVSEVAQDFIDFILSDEGQKVVSDNGYVSIESAGAYSGSKPSGNIKIAGSSSVTPVMEKLREAYLAINNNGTIEINQTDSSSGMQSTIDGVVDIGMASREIKDSELEKGITGTQIAIDGIAVIVNTQNTVDSMTKDQVKKIYSGEYTTWADVIG